MEPLGFEKQGTVEGEDAADMPRIRSGEVYELYCVCTPLIYTLFILAPFLAKP